MRCLVLTDIHDALDAIDEHYDEILVLDDLVDYGPRPEEAVSWVRERNALAVSGNHDFAMATGADCRSKPISYAVSVATREYFRPRMSAEALDYLRNLPRHGELSLAGADAFLVYATPRDPLYEYLGSDADDATWRTAVGHLALHEGWLFLGHTHRPFVRRIGRLTIVNPGSLGMPVDGDARAFYAVWEDGRVELRRRAYDVERAVARLGETDLEHEVVERMAAVLRHAGRGG